MSKVTQPWKHCAHLLINTLIFLYQCKHIHSGVHALWHVHPSSSPYINTSALCMEMVDCGDESPSDHLLLHDTVVAYRA